MKINEDFKYVAEKYSAKLALIIQSRPKKHQNVNHNLSQNLK